MDKKQRRDKEFYKYKKRISKWVSNRKIYFTRDGRKIYNPKTVDILEDRGQLCYKTTSTPCSCYCCSDIYKYQRHEKKQEDRRLLEEFYGDK